MINIFLISFFFIPIDEKIARSLILFDEICMIDEERLNDAIKTINNKVKKVIFFSISVASKSWRFLSSQDKNVVDESLMLPIFPFISAEKFAFLKIYLFTPDTRKSLALKILFEKIFATLNS